MNVIESGKRRHQICCPIFPFILSFIPSMSALRQLLSCLPVLPKTSSVAALFPLQVPVSSTVCNHPSTHHDKRLIVHEASIQLVSETLRKFFEIFMPHHLGQCTMALRPVDVRADTWMPLYIKTATTSHKGDAFFGQFERCTNGPILCLATGPGHEGAWLHDMRSLAMAMPRLSISIRRGGKCVCVERLSGRLLDVWARQGSTVSLVFSIMQRCYTRLCLRNMLRDVRYCMSFYRKAKASAGHPISTLPPNSFYWTPIVSIFVFA